MMIILYVKFLVFYTWCLAPIAQTNVILYTTTAENDFEKTFLIHI